VIIFIFRIYTEPTQQDPGLAHGQKTKNIKAFNDCVRS